jgi:hypothetical protein
MSTDIVTRSGRVTTFEQRQEAYRAIPVEALLDLAEFCRANESCFHEDPRMHAALEGRREVWLRIQEHIHAARRLGAPEGLPAAAQQGSLCHPRLRWPPHQQLQEELDRLRCQETNRYRENSQ